MGSGISQIWISAQELSHGAPTRLSDKIFNNKPLDYWTYQGLERPLGFRCCIGTSVGLWAIL